MTRWIFKILRPDEFKLAESTSAYTGSSADLHDGFIHFSTLQQMPGTVSKHFDDAQQIHILAFDIDLWRDDELKWEPSRGGDLFPHLYDTFDVKTAAQTWSIDRKNGEPFDFDPIERWVLRND